MAVALTMSMRNATLDNRARGDVARRVPARRSRSALRRAKRRGTRSPLALGSGVAQPSGAPAHDLDAGRPRARFRSTGFAANEAGGEIDGPMAIVILGGLAASTAMNLLLLPVLCARYGRFERAESASS
jgi:hypothetical protein